MHDNYFENRDEINIKKIRELLNNLPAFITEFFVGIQMRTSTLTRLNYAYDLRIFFDYIAKRKFKIDVMKISFDMLNDLDSFDIELFLDYLSAYDFNNKNYKCGENAKERKLSTLKSFFKYFYKKDKIKQNIASKVDLPKIHDKAIIKLEPNEVVNLLDLAENADMLSNQQKAFHKKTKSRDIAILTLLLGTGIRVSECVGLDVNDLDFSVNAFAVTRKGGNKSILYFSDEVASALRDYLEWLNKEKMELTAFGQAIQKSNALFFSLQGKRISVRAVELLVKKYSSLITPLKKITPHKLRSTYGTALYRETQDIYIVADVLGHSDINTTKKHYAAISDEIRRNASKVVKLKKD